MYKRQTQGHLKGNEILTRISLLLKDKCRDTDVVARYGGEEFSIIMPETSAEEAMESVERLRMEIEAYPFEGAKKQPNQRLTISAGISIFPENGQGVLPLIEHADIALYEAKHSGKNRCVLSRRKGLSILEGNSEKETEQGGAEQLSGTTIGSTR